MADWYVSSTAWAAIAQFATGSYSVGQIVRPLTAPAFNAQYAFRCTTAGNATAEPNWNSAAVNNTTVTATGGAVFTNVSAQSAYGWSAAAGNLYAISNSGSGGVRTAAGDRVFLSSDHSETTTSVAYLLVLIAVFGVIQIISVNRAGSVPPVAADQLSGASITITSGNFILDAYVNYYWQGITFNAGGTAAQIVFNSGGTKGHYFRNCAFVFSTSNTTAVLTPGNPGAVAFDNTTMQFNAAGQKIALSGSYGVDFKWINTPSATLGTVPTNLFSNSNTAQPMITCRGVDLSAITTTLYQGNGGSFGKILLDSCRIASGVARLGTSGYNASADEVELVNCYDGTTANVGERHTPAGDLTTDRSTTLVGGAQDDVGLFSHKLVSSTRSDAFTMTLDSFWMDVENTLTGSSKTATVEIISSASLNNTDISLTLEYLGTSGSSLASFTSTLPSALTALSALPTSTATWNNQPGTPVKQHLQVTFTPQQAGRLRGIVRLGKASTTMWVNPQITVA